MNYIVQQKYRLILNYFLLLFWPFGVLTSALKRVEHNAYRLILSLLGFYLGYSMITRSGSDGSRIGGRFLKNVDYTLSDFLEIISSTYSGGAGNPDFYLTTVSFLTSRITDNQNIFFGVLGFIYYQFFFKFYARIVSYLKSYGIVPSKDFLLLGILFGICLVYPFSAGINAVRFPLATFVFFYGVVSYILFEKTKYIALVISTIFIHWAFIPVAAIFIIFLIVRKLKKLYVLNFLLAGIVIAGFFATDGGGLIENNALIGSSIQNKLDSYSSENYLLDRQQHFAMLNWYIRLSKLLPYYYSVLVLLITQLPFFSLNLSKRAKSWLVLSALLTVTSFIIGSETGPINNRYIKLSFMASMVYLAFLYSVNQRSRLIKMLMILFIPIGLFLFYAAIRTDMEVYNFVTYFGNMFIFSSAEEFEPIIDIIK